MRRKIKKILSFLGIIGIILFQVTYLESFRILRVKPDLVLIILVLFSFGLGFKKALFLSIFLGFLKDLFALPGYALNTLLFPLWVWLVAQLSRKIVLDNNRLVPAAFVFLVVFLHNLLKQILLIFFQKRAILPMGFFHFLFLESFYTAVLVPLFIFFENLFKLNNARQNYKV